MKYIKRLITTPAVPAIFFLTFPETADPYYLDIGGVILPFIIAALVGASTTIVIYWRKIKTFFNSHFRKGKSIEKDDDAAEDQQ
jgi:hypothetical protein